MHKIQHPTYPLQAVPVLLEYGAQFVLCDHWGNRKADGSQSKKPVHRNWRQQRPGFVAVKDHITSGGLLGIVPSSLNCAVLDVDHGNPTELIATHLPWFLSPTQRPHRLHLWYQDDRHELAEERRGGHWRHESGCSGELLASTGYVVLWGNALQELADTLQDTVFGRGDQADFNTVATDAGMTWAGPGQNLTRREVEVKAEDLPELAEVLPGNRNIALFHHARHYAYRQAAHHDEFLTFADTVADFAATCRDQLPDVEGFPESEAAGIAQSVATWTWTVFAKDSLGQQPSKPNNDSTAPPSRPGRRRLPRRSGPERRFRGPAIPAELPHPTGLGEDSRPRRTSSGKIRHRLAGGQGGHNDRRQPATNAALPGGRGPAVEATGETDPGSAAGKSATTRRATGP